MSNDPYTITKQNSGLGSLNVFDFRNNEDGTTSPFDPVRLDFDSTFNLLEDDDKIVVGSNITSVKLDYLHEGADLNELHIALYAGEEKIGDVILEDNGYFLHKQFNQEGINLLDHLADIDVYHVVDQCNHTLEAHNLRRINVGTASQDTETKPSTGLDALQGLPKSDFNEAVHAKPADGIPNRKPDAALTTPKQPGM